MTDRIGSSLRPLPPVVQPAVPPPNSLLDAHEAAALVHPAAARGGQSPTPFGQRGRVRRTSAQDLGDPGAAGGGGGGLQGAQRGAAAAVRFRRSSNDCSFRERGGDAAAAVAEHHRNTVWVGNIPRQLARGPAQLTRIFGEHGAVLSVTVRQKEEDLAGLRGVSHIPAPCHSPTLQHVLPARYF